MSDSEDKPKSSATATDKRFGARVRALRDERGLTQEEMVTRLRRVGLEYMNASTLSRIEAGKRPIRLVEAQAFSRLLRTTIWELTSEELRVQLLTAVRDSIDQVTRIRQQYTGVQETLATYRRSLREQLDEVREKFPEDEEHPDPEFSDRVDSLRWELSENIRQLDKIVDDGKRPEAS